MIPMITTEANAQTLLFDSKPGSDVMGNTTIAVPPLTIKK